MQVGIKCLLRQLKHKHNIPESAEISQHYPYIQVQVWCENIGGSVKHGSSMKYSFVALINSSYCFMRYSFISTMRSEQMVYARSTSQTVLVKQILCHLAMWFRGDKAFQAACVVTQQLNGFMAVSQKVAFQEVTQLKEKEYIK